MEKIDIKNLEHETVKIIIVDDPDGVRLNIIGSIGWPNSHNLLMPYFNDIHNKVIKAGIKIVKIDIKELAFMNSSGIGSMVQWISQIPALPEKKRYLVKIYYSKDVTWHVRGLHVLYALVPNQIELIEE